MSGDDRDIDRATEVLRAGGLVAMPTETVYGLAGDARSSEAVQRIYRVKGRPLGNPLIVHVHTRALAEACAATWPVQADALVERFWPGPLTLIVYRGSGIAPEVSAGRETLAVRMPAHPIALRLLERFDGPLAAPSANRSTRVSPTTADHVRSELGREVDFVLDGGPCAVGIESTVLDLTSAVPTILRPGAVSQAALQEVLGPVRLGLAHVDPWLGTISPGQHHIHYAPTKPARAFSQQDRQDVLRKLATSPSRIGVLTLGRWDDALRGHPTLAGAMIAMPTDPTDYARLLYASLRTLDARDVSEIWVELPPDAPAWLAVRDRLGRATSPLQARTL